MSASQTLLRVNGVEVGFVWRTHAGWFGALFGWPKKTTPLGPYRTERASKRAIERRARADGLWPQPVRAISEDQTPP